MSRAVQRERLSRICREDHWSALYVIGYLIPDLTDEQLERVLSAVSEFTAGMHTSATQELLRERFQHRLGGRN